jgi:cytochrome c peroxidase
MTRVFWIIVLLAMPSGFAGDRAPVLPKDTLPKKLNIDSIPLGLEQSRPVPKNNPLTDAKAQLGRRLFFDPILSADNRVSCASCHQPEHGYASPEPLAMGIGGAKGRRNAPSVLNRAYGLAQFWDGRADSLEAQALKPIESSTEMGSSVAEALKRLKGEASYVAEFKTAFEGEITAENLANAIASFERVLLTGNNRHDRFKFAGDIKALTERETHGMWLFESRGRCWQCHSGPNFSDEKFHNTGVAWGKEPLDLGRYEVTKQEADRGRFKTPGLRDIARTAPYMHDGSIATLEEVVEYYNRGGNKNSHLDPLMQPLNLSKEDVRDIVAFLRALTGME